MDSRRERVHDEEFWLGLCVRHRLSKLGGFFASFMTGNTQVIKRNATDNGNGEDPLTVCPTCGKPLLNEFGDVTVDHDRYEIHAGDKIVRLTQTEFSLFWMLYRKRGLTVPKEPLFERLVQLRGKRGKLEPRTVDTRMSILRKKVAPLKMRIETRWGEGVALLRGR